MTTQYIAPQDLRCERLPFPLCVEPGSPLLSWRFAIPSSPAATTFQQAFQVLAASAPELLREETADLWNSGFVESVRHYDIQWTGEPLSGGQRVWWTVRVRDGVGTVSPFAEPSWFETGLKDDEWAPAECIAPDYDNWPRPLPGVYLRREFNLPGEIRQARACVCGLGYHELYINGKKAGDRVLEPAQTDYEKYALYSVYDVTEHLNSGPNAAGVILGNGWFNQERVWTDGINPVYGLPAFLAKLTVVLESGETVVIGTSPAWRASEGALRENNVYAGENYDARREQHGWDRSGFDDSGWQAARVVNSPSPVLRPQQMQPIRAIQTIRPVSRAQVTPGVWIYDLGQNFSGWARIRLQGKPGQEICLRFAEEVFADGSLDPLSTGVIHTKVVQTDRYICRGGDVETWTPRFTYHGFRYVEATGLAGDPAEDFLECEVVHTDLPRAGMFNCSDSHLNRIHETALWTQRTNLHGLPTDCPARERCGWLGDAHVAAEMVLLNFDSVPFWRKYLVDMENGLGEGEVTYLGGPPDPRVPANIAPGRRRCQVARPDWGVATVLVPWYLYVYTGDLKSAERHYPMMANFTAYLEEIARDGIVEEGYGDWCPPDGSIGASDCPVPLSSTAYYFMALRAMARMSEDLGKPESAAHYQLAADQTREAFLDRFLDPSGKTLGSQTGNVMGLISGLVRKKDRASVAETLASDLRERQGHFTTGIHGLRGLFEALTDHGHDEVAWSVLHADGHPGFRHLFEAGGTTFWESFATSDGGSIGRSRNHPMQGGFDAWFYKGVGGIAPDPGNPGFRRVLLKPRLIRQLDWADSAHESVCGRIRSSWRRTGREFHWEIELPGNSSGLAVLPCSFATSLQLNDETVEIDDCAIEITLPPGPHKIHAAIR